MVRIVKLTLMVGLFTLIALPASAEAFGVANADTEERDSTKTERSEERKENLQFRCSTVKSKSAARVAKYDSSFRKHVAGYEKMVTRISELLDKLSEKGYDTAAAESSLAQFEALVAQFKNDFVSFKSMMSDADSSICAENREQFLSQLTEARSKLDVIRKDVAAIRNHYLSDLKPKLEALRDQVKADNQANRAVADESKKERE